MDLPSRVGRALVLFLVLVGKMTLKTQKFWKKSDIFTEKFWENSLTYFQEFSTKICRFWSKNGWFNKILEKKICQNWKSGSVTPVKQFFCFVLFLFCSVLFCFSWLYSVVYFILHKFRHDRVLYLLQFPPPIFGELRALVCCLKKIKSAVEAILYCRLSLTYPIMPYSRGVCWAMLQRVIFLANSTVLQCELCTNLHYFL